jgi:hypothetical protein
MPVRDASANKTDTTQLFVAAVIHERDAAPVEVLAEAVAIA